MDKLPPPLKALVNYFSRLPGLGPKSALRCALAVLKWPEHEAQNFGQAIFNLHNELALCVCCGSLAAESPCAICSDPGRARDVLCLVAEWDSLLVMEEGAFYKGQYLVLGGLLSRLDNIHPEALDFERLRLRLASGEVHELVLALGATLEADTTATYLKDLVEREFPQVKVFRLAQGIPLGGEVKFMDKETLRQSLKYRQEV